VQKKESTILPALTTWYIRKCPESRGGNRNFRSSKIITYKDHYQKKTGKWERKAKERSSLKSIFISNKKGEGGGRRSKKIKKTNSVLGKVLKSRGHLASQNRGVDSHRRG